MPEIQGFVLDLSGAKIRRTNLSHANLTRANLSHADLTGADLRGANLAGAVLAGTILRGADLRDVTNLTKEQLAFAVVDDTTILPSDLE
ncbi:MAG: pentapeptide repeat-containing protein [Stellaceae bacterium]